MQPTQQPAAGTSRSHGSILPPLLVPDLRQALTSTTVRRIFAASVMTEPEETDDYSALDQLRAIERHLGAQMFDCGIDNTSPVPEPLSAAYAEHGATRTFELAAPEHLGIRPIRVPLASEHPPGEVRHHPDRLAVATLAAARGQLDTWAGRAEAGGN
jgi:2-phospho-L-lactate transferase/gluconeogenesis factor (CofD/UPF0052 family)